MKYWALSDTLTFGNVHKGEIIKDIIKDDPDYIAWCCDEIGWFELDAEAEEALDLELFGEEFNDDEGWMPCSIDDV